MSKRRKLVILSIVFMVIMSVTVTFGILENPSFNVYDFCTNLCSEFIGWILAVTLFQYYYDEKLALRKTPQSVPTAISTADEIQKFKNLLDTGAITKEEYEQAKARLLTQ